MDSVDGLSLLSAIIHSTGDAIISKNLHGIITSWNAAAERIFGFSEAEAIGQPTSIIIPEHLLNEDASITASIKKAERIKHYETIRKKKTGELFPTAITMSPIYNTAGEIVGVSDIARDISEKNISDEKQALLASIIDSSDDAIISKNLDGVITSWNKGAQLIFGYKASEAIGKHISLIIPETRMDEEAMIIKKIKKGELLNHIETIRKTKDGIEKNVSISISPIKNFQGQIIGASKIARDISEKVVEESKQALLASIISSSDDAIVSKTLNGVITSWNKGAETIFGYTAEEAVGKHISLIIPEDRLDEETMIINKIRSGEKINHIETIRRAKDGTQKYVSITVSPVRNLQGKVIGASKIARDISERKEIERQKKLYIKQLKELNDYKDEFMTMASHELKTPLTVIKSNLQVLDMIVKEPAEKDFLNKAFQHLDKLSNLISDLLDVSKMQSGVLDLNITSFNIIALFKEVMEHLQLTSAQHLFVLETENESIMLEADKARLEQVIVNLLTNAIKYSPHGNKIEVRLSASCDQFIAAVTDFGIGIAAEHFEKVFTRFFRVQGIASTFSGSGIGLYISQQIIVRHGGKIWVESQIGQGTTFYFSLPLHKVQEI